MQIIRSCFSILAISSISLGLSSCSSVGGYSDGGSYGYNTATPEYSSRMASNISTTEKVVVIDPRSHAWGAYDNQGNLLKSGLATSGADYCKDIGRRCHTSSGSFRVQSLGDAGCKSKIFPLHKGGAPMPYCMFFNGGQAIHGDPPSAVVDGNISHGCVRMHVADAEWLRFNFVNVGTKVVVKPYN